MDFGKAFTGLALVFEPTVRFVEPPAPRPRGFRVTAFLSEQRYLVWAVALTALVAQALATVGPFMTGFLIDRVLPRADYSLLLILALLFTAVQSASLFASFARTHLLLYLKCRLQRTLTARFIEHLARLPYRFFQEHTSGDLLVRLASNDSVRDIVISTALAVLVDGTTAIVFLLALAVTNLKLAAIAFVLAVARVVLLLITRNPQRHILAEMLENHARSQTSQVELLNGMETLKAMAAEERAVQEWLSIFIDGLAVSVRQGRLEALMSLVLGAIGAIGFLALTYYGAVLVLRGDMTLGVMMACAALAGAFMAPISSLVAAGTQLQALDVYLERIVDVMNTPAERSGGSGPDVYDPPGGGRIELRNVSFRYSPIAPLVLEDISMAVEPGQRVAITGPSGSGKTTLARLIAGLYEPVAGEIRIGGVDFRQLDKQRVRGQLGVVTQDPQLFSGTIRANIAMNDPEMALDAVVLAAKVACIHDDIMKMRLGYDTPLTDRGLSLSGGQRQRLAIARAVARRPRILLMDEATSSVDSLTQERLKRHLASLSCTQIVIAHRLSTIRDADLVVVLDGGRIVAAGIHDALMRENGLYTRLAREGEAAPAASAGREQRTASA
jgi:ATP-binding cassette, subfamily B, bacterial